MCDAGTQLCSGLCLCLCALLSASAQPYLTRHQELKDAYDAAILADPSLAPAKRGGKPSANSGSQHEQGALSHDILLPLSRVKKIMDLDSGGDSAAASASAGSSATPAKATPKGRVSKEGLLVLEKATEHFIAWVATRAHQVAVSSKRKGLKSGDLEAVVKSSTPLEFLRAPLKRDFERMAALEAQQGEERKERFEEIKRKKAKAKEEAAAVGDAGEHKEGGEDEGTGTADFADNGDEAAGSAVTPSPAKPKPKPVRTIDSMFSKAAK